MYLKSILSNLILLLLCICALSSWLFIIDDLNLESLSRYSAVCCSLLLFNKSRALKHTDALLVIVGLIIVASGLVAMFFNWPLDYEICLLGGVFLLIGYIDFIRKHVEIGIFEYSAVSFLFLGLSYLVFKLTYWSGGGILEILGILHLFALFLLHGFKKVDSDSTTRFSENTNKNVLA